MAKSRQEDVEFVKNMYRKVFLAGGEEAVKVFASSGGSKMPPMKLSKREMASLKAGRNGLLIKKFGTCYHCSGYDTNGNGGLDSTETQRCWDPCTPNGAELPVLG